MAGLTVGLSWLPCCRGDGKQAYGRRMAVADKLLLTPEEAAEALGVSRRTVYMLLTSRALDSVKIGALRRVPVDALRDYVAGLRATSGVA